MDVSRRNIIKAYLGLGSNLADRLGNLHHAIYLISDILSIHAISPVYETAPWGFVHQPMYLNCTLSICSPPEPSRLKSITKTIESQVGRKSTTHRWGPRIIDIDILFYGNQRISQPGLVIPPLRIDERAFVLVPLSKIAPAYVHPRSNKTIQELCDIVDGKDGVQLYSNISINHMDHH